MQRLLLILPIIFICNTYGAQFLCQPLDEYGLGSKALIVELDASETAAIVLMEQDGEFVQFPYNKKVVMKPSISGDDGRWFGNDFDYPGEEYQVFLSRDNTKMRFWVDIFTNDFFGFASAYSESCVQLN